MTTLQFPSLERRLLHTLTKEVESSVQDWPAESFEVCLHLLHQLKESVSAGTKKVLEVLAGGIETRELTSLISPHLSAIDETLTDIRLMLRALSKFDSRDEVISIMAAALELEKETHRFRCFLTNILSDASQPRGPVDWDRVEAAGQEYDSGKMRRFC